jgi:hypothetical protein
MNLLVISANNLRRRDDATQDFGVRLPHARQNVVIWSRCASTINLLLWEFGGTKMLRKKI